MTETLTYKDRTIDIKDIKKVSEALNRTINNRVIRQAQAELSAMISEYAKEIDEAYIKADNDLTVALSLKLAPTRIAGEVELTVGINFVESRVKHAIKIIVDSKQRKLPGFER